MELDITPDAVPQQVWPLPQAIPWAQVRIEDPHATGHHEPVQGASATEWFSRFSRAVERSLQGYVNDAPSQHPPSKCFGRGRRLKPEKQSHLVFPKLYRPREEVMRHDQLGAEVLRWYRQLRRLQSLLHSLRSGSGAATAQTYRLELWQAIMRGKGFKGGFKNWWPARRLKLAGRAKALLPCPAA